MEKIYRPSDKGVSSLKQFVKSLISDSYFEKKKVGSEKLSHKFSDKN